MRIPTSPGRLWFVAVLLTILASHASGFVSHHRGALKGSRHASSVNPRPFSTELYSEANNGGGKKAKKSIKATTKKKKIKKKKLKKRAADVVVAAQSTRTTTKVASAPPPQPVPEPPVSPIQEQIQARNLVRAPADYEPVTSHKSRPGIDVSLLGDLTGGRPGAIIETEEQLERKQEIFEELDTGVRQYNAETMSQYGTPQEFLGGAFDEDDPTAIDMATLGTWTIRDLQAKFEYEWDPEQGDPDPNHLEMLQPGVKYKETVEVDDDGVELGFNPLYGPSSALDTRTILGAQESYMINDKTKDDSMLPPQFPEGDLEIDYNQEVVNFRKSLDIIETYTDEFLPPEMPIPRHVAKWHGYPEPMSYPHQTKRQNPFVDPETATDFSVLTPYQARRKAVELARAQNSDWLPNGKSQAWHASKREPYEKIGTLVGTLRKADDIDETLVKAIQPVLDVLGSCVELLSIEGEDQTVFRFWYHGLMKNRHGIAAWTETMIREDCNVDVTGVIFETGFRRRDFAYEGGDHWYPPKT
ncbi:expressed unknown protein [Seminavis robusta]|uniref:Uncharacterized protein n=1 Tax=Seminavis robusta TaxID=568900 RepID=A0A9N8EF38_9STRA|nr:expressed unknown protein [Seminavis robusta]|eukprot:Sro1090_g240160.1 n/a (528) ;mRNA; r:15489-17072